MGLTDEETRHIDMEVATKIMGATTHTSEWSLVVVNNKGPDEYICRKCYPNYPNPDSKYPVTHIEYPTRKVYPHNEPPPEETHYDDPFLTYEYTSRIDHAFKILQKLDKEGWTWNLHSASVGFNPQCELFKDGYIQAYGSTIEEAICKAALKTIQ